eukprot:462630_1
MNQKTPARITRYANKSMNHQQPYTVGACQEARPPTQQASASIKAEASIKSLTKLNTNPNEIVCTFHMGFIPKLDDLQKYVRAFGVVRNAVEIKWVSVDCSKKGKPMAKIAFGTVSSAQHFCDVSFTHVTQSEIGFLQKEE